MFEMSNLNAGLWQADLQRHVLPHEDVRVPRFSEQPLQYVQLGSRESRSLPPLLPRIS